MTVAPEPPTWKRFCDAPPPDGFYWIRTSFRKREQYDICEVEGDTILFLGTDERSFVKLTYGEYYTQPILPPQ